MKLVAKIVPMFKTDFFSCPELRVKLSQIVRRVSQRVQVRGPDRDLDP